MPDVALTSLDVRLQKQVESAQSASQQGDADRAAEIYATILKEQPGCVAVRKLERTVLLKATVAKPGGLARMVRVVSSSPFLFNGNLRLKDEPRLALASAEQVLRRDPENVAALSLLSQAALALGWPETAVFAAETARGLEPDRPDLALALGHALMAAGRTAEAVAAAKAALRLQADHAGALALQRDAAVADTLARDQRAEGGNATGPAQR